MERVSITTVPRSPIPDGPGKWLQTALQVLQVETRIILSSFGGLTVSPCPDDPPVEADTIRAILVLRPTLRHGNLSGPPPRLAVEDLAGRKENGPTLLLYGDYYAYALWLEAAQAFQVLLGPLANLSEYAAAPHTAQGAQEVVRRAWQGEAKGVGG